MLGEGLLFRRYRYLLSSDKGLLSMLGIWPPRGGATDFCQGAQVEFRGLLVERGLLEGAYRSREPPAQRSLLFRVFPVQDILYRRASCSEGLRSMVSCSEGLRSRRPVQMASVPGLPAQKSLLFGGCPVQRASSSECLGLRAACSEVLLSRGPPV